MWQLREVVMKEISSVQNPMVKEVVKLKERRERDSSGLFLIEGYRECKRANEGGVSIQTLLICPELFLGVNEKDLIHSAREKGADIIQCSPQIFAKISYRDRPDGLVAIAQQMQRGLADLEVSSNPFFVVAEAIEKPGNLGTILRSADAVGIDGVIVCDRCTDIYNPNVVRASVGTLFTIPVVEAGGVETLMWLREQKIQIVAATPSAKLEYTEADFTGPVALAVGTEQFGLSEGWMQNADIQVRIPMNGVADSLNVATATTLLLYEVLRQRRFHESHLCR
jgi:TrmH family RNA methyltransferase